MTGTKVITAGREPDPAKRLRQKWGAEIRSRRLLFGWTLKDFADELAKHGVEVTPAAVGMWERGETAPRPHHQAGVARTVQTPHHLLFSVADEVA